MKELKIFFTAVTFFTRIPVHKLADFSKESLNQSSKYFPLVGVIIGAVGAGVFYLCSLFFPPVLSALLSTAATILLTGAFHEDAFADVCDAFGGGWTKERILEIMKDSCIGAFGTVGVVMMLTTKIAGIAAIPLGLAPVAIIVSHSVSRMACVAFIYSHEYVTENDKSKSKPLAKNIKLKSFFFAVFTGIVPVLLFQSWYFFLILIPVWLTKVFMAAYFKKWIGGYTGDCLGSVQQVSEVVVYLSVTIIVKLFL